MRLGVVTTSYPRFPGDPAGSFVAGHVAALRALGHAVDVIAAGDGPDDDPAVVRIASALFYGGGAPDRLERAPIRGVVDAAAFVPRVVAAIRARAHAWDGAIAHWLAPSAIALLAATPRALPLLAIAHGGDVHLLHRTHLLAPTLRALARRRARVTYASAALRALADAAHPIADARVQPMGIERARFAALRAHPRAHPPTIAVLARLVPIKGVDVAIDAVAALHARGIDVRLAIAGDGPERAALAHRARGLPIELLGELAAPARDALLARAAVVAIPSRVLASGRTEGTPLVALEALAAGVPVVASATGGLVDLAPEVALVPPDAPDALADALIRALAAPAPDLPDRYDWSVIGPQLLPALASR